MVAHEKITRLRGDLLLAFDHHFDTSGKKDDPQDVFNDPIGARFRFFDGLLEIDEKRDGIAIDKEEGEKEKPIGRNKQHGDKRGPGFLPPQRKIVSDATEKNAEG